MSSISKTQEVLVHELLLMIQEDSRFALLQYEKGLWPAAFTLSNLVLKAMAGIETISSKGPLSGVTKSKIVLECIVANAIKFSKIMDKIQLNYLWKQVQLSMLVKKL